MAHCKMDLTFSESPEAFFQKMQTKLAKAGGSLEGSPASGAFHIDVMVGRVSGQYTVTGQVISITITEKPFLVGCGTIEGLLRGQLTGG